MACRINKTSEWSVRLLYESTQYEYSTFVTLTYADEYMPANGSLVKEDWQKFMKRLRKRFDGEKFRYYMCGEYGPTTFRPHYHAIIFGLNLNDWVEISPGKFISPTLSELWPQGFNQVGFVNPTTMNYVTGYIQKKQYGQSAVELYEKRGVIPPFQLFSKHLGQDFSLAHADQISKNMFVIQNGRKKPVPKYISKKIGLDQSPTGFRSDSPLVQKAISQARKRLEDFEKAKLEMVTDFYDDYDQYMISVNAQRENELKAKEKAYKSRDKI